MKQTDIERINELYHKSQNEGLTQNEKVEQANLRKEYIQAVRNNMRGSLNNVSILEKDGSVTELSDVAKKKQEERKN